MKKYYVQDAKCDVIGAGLFAHTVVGAVKYKTDDTEEWLYCEETDGMPEFYLSKNDIFGDLIKEDVQQQEFEELRDGARISELDDISLGEYEEIFENIYRRKCSPAVPLLRYLITLVRCDNEDIESIISMGKGKYIDEVDIPQSDVEEEFYEDLEEENDDDESVKTVEFEYYVSFGRGDSSDYMPCEVELTKAEWKKLQDFYKENPGEEALGNEGFEEIREKFINAAVQCDWENSFDVSDMLEYLEENREDFDEVYEVTFEDAKEYYTEYASIEIVENIDEEAYWDEDEAEEE